MKKTLFLFLLGVCIAVNAFSQSLQQIEINSRENTHPRFIEIIPIVYQNKAQITIELPTTVATYATVIITNKETGKQVYSMVYSHISYISIELSVEDKGEYIIDIDFNSRKYYGVFIL